MKIASIVVFGIAFSALVTLLMLGLSSVVDNRAIVVDFTEHGRSPGVLLVAFMAFGTVALPMIALRLIKGLAGKEEAK